jgi:hypothetical protein
MPPISSTRFSCSRIHISQIYATAALNLDFFQHLYSADCWSVEWGASLPTATHLQLHVYDFQALLLALPNSRRLLPSAGLTLTQALDASEGKL